jgi:energy-coupling factor transporter ATP-binding protein EcfA2
MITTIIEKYLLSVDQATFQKMMNHLLHLEGYKFIGSPGSVIGRNKTSKGSPDSFFEDGDNYTFCEYTTQEKLSTGETFFKKLKSDVEHCFDVKSTGIVKSKISKVVLAFTEEIKPNEHNELKGKVKNHNPKAELVIYSIQEIPFRLVYYPGLADKYIPGIKTTKGTLYTLLDFLKTTEKGLQPSLTNPFTGREEEIKQAKEFLLSNDILIITGSQGVGKSKLAVHLAEIFESEFGYEPRVIASSPVPLWDDLTNFILPSNKYFIFFDDANKSLPNLDYLLQFINSRDKDTTKIVITVRDYVRNDLNKYLLNVPHKEIILIPFEDKQIAEIINKSMPENISLDALVLERIISLSKGNSRISLMAVSSILQNNDIRILKDVFSLYDQYFQKVKADLSFLDKSDNLKALGILSFFGVLDRNDDETNEAIQKHFSINWNELWETFIELEKVELVDVFHKEAAKISDQVLATYVFYKTFIDENSASINYSDWIVQFIEKYDRKVNKTLIDIINTFGFDELRDGITSLITEVQRKIETDTNKLYKFFEIFWFYREVDTLLFIRNWINNLEDQETELADIKYTYEVNDYVWAPEYLKLLINFWHHSTPFTKEAIELGLKLMFKQPSRIPEVLKHLNENLAFHRFDFRYGYPRQLTLIDTLSSKDFNFREKAISEQIFLSLVPSFLGWEFHQTEGKGGGQMIIYNFSLRKTNSLMELRKKILERLFDLFSENEVRVLVAMNKYAWTSRSFDSSVYANEQPMIAEFLSKNLRLENYSHCKLVHEYVKTLKEHNIELLNDWNRFLNSDSMQIAKIFSSKFDDEKLKYDEQEKKKKEEIKSFVTDRDINFIETTFERLDSIYKDATINRDTFWIDSSLSYLFQALAETDSKLYFKSLELLMLGKYSFELTYGNIIFYPIQKKLVDSKELYKHLNRYEYKQKQFWKQMFFEAIEENEIDEFFLQEFIGFIFSVIIKFYLHDLDKYIKFDKQFHASQSLLPLSAVNHKNVVTYITEILLSNTGNTDITFDHHFCEKCSKYFSEKHSLLKQVFYLHKKRDAHYDYDGREMAAISDLDHYFLIEYLSEITNDVTYINFKFDSLNLTFIWDLPEYEDILDKALEIIISKAPIFSNFEHQANVLFNGLKLNEEQLEKVYRYISRFISNNNSSKQHIHIILNVVTYSFNNQILRFLKEFLVLNKDIEFMKHLWLEKNDAYSGSRVPRIEGHITFVKSIVDMIKTLSNPLDYSEHIKHWEQEIEWLKKEKLDEMKLDFTGWTD